MSSLNTLPTTKSLANKMCSKCRVSKPLTEFFKRNTRPSGYASSCKACHKVMKQTPASKQKAAKYARQYRKDHPEHIVAANAAYYEAHADERRADAMSWALANPERKAATYKRWYDDNREEQIERAIEFARTHPELSRQNRRNRRARVANSEGSFSVEEWNTLKAFYEYTCLRCGQRESDITLTADHVIPLSKGGRNDIGNIQPLCISCNCSKRTQSTDYRETHEAVAKESDYGRLSCSAVASV